MKIIFQHMVELSFLVNARAGVGLNLTQNAQSIGISFQQAPAASAAQSVAASAVPHKTDSEEVVYAGTRHSDFVDLSELE